MMRWLRYAALVLAMVAMPQLAWSGAPEASLPAMPTHTGFSIASRLLGETRHINVYTPPGYADHARARYPVLYMPDGGMQEDFPHVAADVDAAIRAGQMAPMIVSASRTPSGAAT